jgi:chitodextrinase
MKPLVLTSKAAPLSQNPSTLTIDNEHSETYYVKGTCVEAFLHESQASVTYPSIAPFTEAISASKVNEEEEEKAQDKVLSLSEFNVSKFATLTSIRFTPFNLQSKLSVSPTGLALTANATDEEMAIGNIGRA